MAQTTVAATLAMTLEAVAVKLSPVGSGQASGSATEGEVCVCVRINGQAGDQLSFVEHTEFVYTQYFL